LLLLAIFPAIPIYTYLFAISGGDMAKTKALASALALGEQRAKHAIKERKAALRKRDEAVRKLVSGKRIPDKPHPKGATVFAKGAGAPGSAGLIIAEGDSWFDYPGNDVLSLLEDNHAYDVEAVSRAGDRVENMAYTDGQLHDFCRMIEKSVREGKAPAAILISGGGNDVAGPAFEMLIEHALSPNPGLNQSVVDGILNQRIFYSYVTIIKSVTDLCLAKLGYAVPIITHGYDYSVPDGRGFGWSFIPFMPGPWLKPGLESKGYSEDGARRAIIVDLMKAFNRMMPRLKQVPGFGHVHVLDLRGTLSTDSRDYKDWWANELHPTKDGFAAVADLFAQKIERVRRAF
jgi:hypothetical protein